MRYKSISLNFNERGSLYIHVLTIYKRVVFPLDQKRQLQIWGICSFSFSCFMLLYNILGGMRQAICYGKYIDNHNHYKALLYIT